LQDRVAAQIAETRAEADAAIKRAKNELAQEVEAAKAGLTQDSEALADQIAESILRRRAA
jgi:F0F1-type ATP synthase membrane subunit b/b'